MKNCLLLLFILFTISLLADNLPSNDLHKSKLIPKKMEKIGTFESPISNREAPLVEFSQPPITLMESYYKYMIGGYKAPSIVKQPAIAQPGGYTADGYYVAFMAKAEHLSQRRVYYSYINSYGDATQATPVSYSNLNQGFMSIDMDPVTANPLIAWHGKIDEDGTSEVMFSYDWFNAFGTPGLWQDPYLLTDNPLEGEYPNSCYMWPVLRIGKSPLAGYRRAHIYATFLPAEGQVIYHIIYGHADFTYEDNYGMVFGEWNFQTIPLFENWSQNYILPYMDLVLSDDSGELAFVGFTPDTLFAVVSQDYGESFEVNLFEGKTQVDNPQNQDGSYCFPSFDGTPIEVFITPSSTGRHFNAKYSTGNQSAVFLSTMCIRIKHASGIDAFYSHSYYPKIFCYDFIHNEYSIVDLQTTGSSSNEPPVVPWDLNGDGDVDEFDEDGRIKIADSWPLYYFDGDYTYNAIDESLYKIATTENGQYQVAVFQDSRKHRKAFNNTPGYEDWLEVAEIVICVSNDYGETWSDPAYLNAKPDDENFYPELEGMYPSYIYPTEDIVMEGGLLKVPLLFLNDSVYGGYHHMPIPPAEVSFAILSVDPNYTSIEDEDIPDVRASLTNYPNPFNPETKIEYEIVRAGDVSLEVFNVKGQKIKTLVNDYKAADSYAVTWNGKDNAGNSCSSGLYFYKLKTSAQSTVKKMILMK